MVRQRAVEQGLSKKLPACITDTYYITDLAGPYSDQLRFVENIGCLKISVHANRLGPYMWNKATSDE